MCTCTMYYKLLWEIEKADVFISVVIENCIYVEYNFI